MGRPAATERWETSVSASCTQRTSSQHAKQWVRFGNSFPLDCDIHPPIVIFKDPDDIYVYQPGRKDLAILTTSNQARQHDSHSQFQSLPLSHALPHRMSRRCLHQHTLMGRPAGDLQGFLE
nr:hypothetical protein CFP56_33730 [Quercus suber]